MTIDTAETLGEHYGRAIENPENYERMKEQYISTAAEALPAIGDLTARKILRANPSLGKAAAAKLAAEVHDIIRCVRAFGDAFGHPYGVEDDPDEIETLVEMLLRHAAKDGTDDRDWVMDMLTHIDGRLYARYLFVCDIAWDYDQFPMCYAKFIGTDMSSWRFDDFNNDQQRSFMNDQLGYDGNDKVLMRRRGY